LARIPAGPLTEKINNIQSNLKKSEEKIETLRHEKMFLVQEKSELQGYFKKLGSLKIKDEADTKIAAKN